MLIIVNLVHVLKLSPFSQIDSMCCVTFLNSLGGPFGLLKCGLVLVRVPALST
jgi:hypothetical protein